MILLWYDTLLPTVHYNSDIAVRFVHKPCMTWNNTVSAFAAAFLTPLVTQCFPAGNYTANFLAVVVLLDAYLTANDIDTRARQEKTSSLVLPLVSLFKGWNRESLFEFHWISSSSSLCKEVLMGMVMVHVCVDVAASLQLRICSDICLILYTCELPLLILVRGKRLLKDGMVILDIASCMKSARKSN